ncbi:hypothetical protein HPB51_000476 [Rhipicephalus microplus]|uniref:C2H2-type domain-containing protein n=1 Tax=Rhipicephalus microplus TaxID=6941 RepID=A0A9J6D3Q2_RHIMP|nr:hypothetical protein HPB51_000476 [Rhipicephalus microplus]
MEVRNCPRCPFFSAQFIKVVNHIGVVHSVEPNFSVFCGIDGCSSTYKKFSSYKSHLYRRHRTLLEDTGSSLKHRSHGGTSNADRPDGMGNESFHQQEAGPGPLESDSVGTRNEEPVNDSAKPGTSKRKADFQCFLEEAKSALWRFFFSATEHHNLSHTAVEKLFSELQLVFELVLKAYANEIAHAVKTLGADRELDLLLSCSFIPDLFKGLDKKRAREKYAKETFPFVAPEEQVLGQGATYHYVPLPKLLHVLCNIPDIGAHLKTPEPDNQTPSVYRDYTDGMLYREHLRSVIPQSCAYTVIILFYTDEIEVVNPLGAKRGTHKLLAVYCCLLNLHARYRSKLESIYLVMLVRYAYVKTYGLTPVLQPLLTDLNHLFDEGLTIDLEGITTNVGVLLFGFSGDNLSMHRLGGFTCSFSNGRVCRFCMVSTKQLSLQTSESLCKVRTTDRHKLHLQAISVNGAANKRLYGVNESSVLLQLPYADVTRQLPPDLMHDVLEGGAECVLRHILNALLSAGLLLRSDLDRVCSFEYGPNDNKNKAVEINVAFLTSKAALKGTASSKWCLLRFLPLILEI